jgi:hypothetical protein
VVKKKKSSINFDKSKYSKKGRLKKKYYIRELGRLREELVKLQYWIKNQGLRVKVCGSLLSLKGVTLPGKEVSSSGSLEA